MIERPTVAHELQRPEDLRGGRYVLLNLLGRGGMARVYRAEDRELGVQRAIKILSPTKGRRGEHLRARFRTEARAMASLSHPNILSVHDIGTEGDLDYIVMDLAPNGSLMDRLDALDTIPIGLAIQWILEVLSALATAHAAGIVHRDVKPQNVLLSVDDRPLLADFGIAMLADRDLRTTRTGVAMGSMAYMPPEQRVDASKVTHLADIYGVGASLYALLSGQSPVDLFLVDAGSPRWEGIVEPLIPILQRACAASPANRYTSAGEMALALQRFVADVPGIRLELPALSFPDPSPAVYSRTSDPQTPTPRQRRALASNDPLPTRDSSEDAGPTLMPGETPLVEGRPPRWIQAAGVLGILGILGVLGLGILPALIGGPGEDPPTVQPSLASTLPVPTPPAGEAEDGAGVGDGRAGDEDGRAGDGRAGDEDGRAG
ncbi:MAG TPA: serine/threonine protein kinase, partial [Deltaproteobacteria bacterium]|nr:serine/threonine protein kinase [Deltaproteobacteria bacterium]